jgi:hypothetical protein
MFCISGELKFYQCIRGGWIGISHGQDMGNMPHCPYQPAIGFPGTRFAELAGMCAWILSSPAQFKAKTVCSLLPEAPRLQPAALGRPKSL